MRTGAGLTHAHTVSVQCTVYSEHTVSGVKWCKLFSVHTIHALETRTPPPCLGHERITACDDIPVPLSKICVRTPTEATGSGCPVGEAYDATNLC